MILQQSEEEGMEIADMHPLFEMTEAEDLLEEAGHPAVGMNIPRLILDEVFLREEVNFEVEEIMHLDVRHHVWAG